LEPELPENLFFVGFMGAGKTSIGRLVAQRLGRPFFDTDHEIEARCGVTVATIFEMEGEEGFRDRESRVLQDLTGRSGIVLATGGGAVLRPANRELLRSRGLVIYLEATPSELWRRVRHNRNRPLLQTENPRARLEALFKVRDPLYREAAHLIMPAWSGSVSSAANAVLGALSAGRANVAGPRNRDDRDDRDDQDQDAEAIAARTEARRS